MNGFSGPSGGVAPGRRRPFDAPNNWGHPIGYSPFSGFSPTDLDKCYPMPAWVAERIRDYPQQSAGNSLRDPLPIPFTANEVRAALLEVWGARRQRNDRRCATVSAASVQIAIQVLPILISRNGGWIDFSGRRYNPLVNTPGSSRGTGVSLRCLLFKLIGKPIPRALGCDATSPVSRSRTYSILDVATTFRGPRAANFGQALGPAGLPGTMRPSPPGRPWIGSDFDAGGLAPMVSPALPLFDLIAAFEAQGQ